MKRLIAFVATVFVASTAFAADYTVDGDHSEVGFKVRHMGISSVAGRFLKVDGSFTFDAKNIAGAKAQATIAANSVDTRQAKRDEHLRTADFFDVQSHPEITFVSKEIKDIQGNSFKVLGDLSIRGQSKPIVLNATFNGTTTDPWGNERAGFEAEATINRKDWGIVWNKLLDSGGLVVGEEVKITLQVEGVRKKA